MTEFSNALTVLSSGMRGQGQRLRHIAENIANVDTPGYRRKIIEFREEIDEGQRTGTIQVGRVRLSTGELPRIHDPEHPMADTQGYHDGSNVQLVTELADAREAQRSYEANLKMFEQVRRMSSQLMDILKR
ncbi:flagellar basal-body rod protein FlgC [Jannaschia faecimaris]|uniref:Flagellar basal body rod protein FlgB n=1 Tax=Jannaschia faecimaris TaxID=1244108 RepID=A0A1H3JW40_9RHOB|nr:flagellar basal body rod protein FlgC [Jannaschia faecimaris]SDY44162.1 flagellar basal-body rod protein FlgC [Jannaschia faecimaris]